MPPVVGQYDEVVGNLSPSQAGFDVAGGGRASLPVYTDDATKINDEIEELLGTVSTDTNSTYPGLYRNPPLGHPQFNWLYAERVSSIQGLGGAGTKTASGPAGALEAPVLPYYWKYPKYKLTVDFTPRPYLLLSDSKISSKQTTVAYYRPSFTAPYYTTEQYNVVPEWERFTDYEEMPTLQFLTAQQGLFTFDVFDGSRPNGQSAGSGQLKMRYAKTTIKFRWYFVPYDYIINPHSWIAQGLGCVNTNDWYGWDRGTLLYSGVTYKRYTPVVPQYVQLQDTVAFSNAKLVDIEFTFDLLDPPLAKAPGRAKTPGNINDKGHSLVPFGALSSWFAASADFTDQATQSVIPGMEALDGQTIYQSIPYELLFQNPKVAMIT